MHELRNNFGSPLELYRHICPKTGLFNNRGDSIDEAIPPILLLPNLPDNWAIALLVRFTTARNPRSGVQTEKCFMDLAHLDFQRRSGNHIMKNAIKFGETFDFIPLPPTSLTNRELPQLCEPFSFFSPACDCYFRFICQGVQPNVDMKMCTIRQTIIKETYPPISEHDACRLSLIDAHIYSMPTSLFVKFCRN
jgi:hypothetical protein